MAHFAQIDGNNRVVNVVVVANENLLDDKGKESEEIGKKYLSELGIPGTWIQTSYNGNFRGLYAGRATKYDPDKDEFVL